MNPHGSLREIRNRNNRILASLGQYLDRDPRFVTREMMEELLADGFLDEKEAYFLLLSAAFGLDLESRGPDRELAENWLRPGLQALEPRPYLEDPYYRDIRIPNARSGRWELRYETYRPYELFVRDDLLVLEDFREIPRTGFFREEFRFPAVLEDDREWMAIKPSEIETMRPILAQVSGRVVAFGLGLGYFAYLASLKEEVEAVTVVERDPKVVELFTRHILPQFSRKDKVAIVEADAFDYVRQRMPREGFDAAFVDLWHDASDGLDLYLRFKPLESSCPGTAFHYWVEESLLSSLRWNVFDSVLSGARSEVDASERLGRAALRRRALLGP